MKTILVAVLATAMITMGFAYAENVTLPYDTPYENKFCFTTVSQEGDVGEIKYTCNWQWLTTKEIATQVQEIMENPIDTEIDKELIKDIVEGNPLTIPDEPEVDVTDPEQVIVDIEIDEPLTLEEQHVFDAVTKLDECLRGLGPWLAFQTPGEIPNYVNATRGEFAIRDNLQANLPIKYILLAIEECRGMAKALSIGTIGPAEANMALADALGLDYYGRTAESRATLDDSQNTLNFRLTDADFERTQQDAHDYMCGEENLHLGLCRAYLELTADNRGNPYIEGVSNIFATEVCNITGHPDREPICKQEMYNAWLSHVAATADTQEATDRAYYNAKLIQCELYFPEYKTTVGTMWFPQWLNHCIIPTDQLCFKGGEKIDCQRMMIERSME